MKILRSTLCFVLLLSTSVTAVAHQPTGESTAINELRENLGYIQDFQRDWTESRMESLSAHMKQKQLLLQSIQARSEILRSEQNDLYVAERRAKSKKPPTLRHATEAIEEKLLGKCLEKLLDRRLELAATKALIEEQKKKLHSAAREVADSNARKELQILRMETAKRNLQLSREKLELTRKEWKNGGINRSKIIEAELQVSQKQLEVEALEAEHRLEDSALASANQTHGQQAELQLELKRLEFREKAALKELDSIAEAANLSREIRRMKDEQRALQEESLALQRQRLELKLELMEMESLHSTVNRELKEADESGEQTEK